MKISEITNPEDYLFMVELRPIRTCWFISYITSNDVPVTVPCIINEKRYKLKDNYKVTLQSTINGFGKRHFYQMDLESLIHRGQIKAYRLVQD